jgi:hypothetical protein
MLFSSVSPLFKEDGHAKHNICVWPPASLELTNRTCDILSSSSLAYKPCDSDERIFGGVLVQRFQ